MSMKEWSKRNKICQCFHGCIPYFTLKSRTKANFWLNWQNLCTNFRPKQLKDPYHLLVARLKDNFTVNEISTVTLVSCVYHIMASKTNARPTTVCFIKRFFNITVGFQAPIHTTSEEFENGGFTLKTHQMFSVHTTPAHWEEFVKATITGHFGSVFEESSDRKITRLLWRHRFRKASAFSNCFPSTRKRKADVFGLKSVSRTVGLTENIHEVRFQISPAQRGQGLSHVGTQCLS